MAKETHEERYERIMKLSPNERSREAVRSFQDFLTRKPEDREPPKVITEK